MHSSSLSYPQQWDRYSDWAKTEMEKLTKKAIMTTCKQIQLNSQRELFSVCPKANTPNPKWQSTVAMGILCGKYKKQKGEGVVHVIGHRALPGTHRTKWLEAGTEERYHTDGHYCGKIEPMDFFEKGWNNTPKEAILSRIMEFGMKRIDEIEKKY